MNSNKENNYYNFHKLTLLTGIIVTLVALGSRQSGYDSAKKKSLFNSWYCKNHWLHIWLMEYGSRETFYQVSIKLMKLMNFGLLRAKSVTEQFGKSALGNELQGMKLIMKF